MIDDPKSETPDAQPRPEAPSDWESEFFRAICVTDEMVAAAAAAAAAAAEPVER